MSRLNDVRSPREEGTRIRLGSKRKDSREKEEKLWGPVNIRQESSLRSPTTIST